MKKGTRLKFAVSTPRLDVANGVHTMTLAVEPAKLKSLRIELADVANSPVQVQIVSGK